MLCVRFHKPFSSASLRLQHELATARITFCGECWHLSTTTTVLHYIHQQQSKCSCPTDVQHPRRDGFFEYPHDKIHCTQQLHILCTIVDTGAYVQSGTIIGKGGRLINETRKATGATIKLMDPQPGAPTRMVACCNVMNLGFLCAYTGGINALQSLHNR